MGNKRISEFTAMSASGLAPDNDLVYALDFSEQYLPHKLKNSTVSCLLSGSAGSDPLPYMHKEEFKFIDTPSTHLYNINSLKEPLVWEGPPYNGMPCIARIRCWGAGGGGGSGNGNGNAGGGGGGGAYCEVVTKYDPGDQWLIYIGSGGRSGMTIEAPGVSGGDTKVILKKAINGDKPNKTIAYACGGAGGGGASKYLDGGAGGYGGTASNSLEQVNYNLNSVVYSSGDVVSLKAHDGAAGADKKTGGLVGGIGGGSYTGGRGGRGTSIEDAADARNGNFPGAGGGGGGQITADVTLARGAYGADGYVTIEYNNNTTDSSLSALSGAHSCGFATTTTTSTSTTSTTTTSTTTPSPGTTTSTTSTSTTSTSTTSTSTTSTTSTSTTSTTSTSTTSTSTTSTTSTSTTSTSTTSTSTTSTTSTSTTSTSTTSTTSTSTTSTSTTSTTSTSTTSTSTTSTSTTSTTSTSTTSTSTTSTTSTSTTSTSTTSTSTTSTSTTSTTSTSTSTTSTTSTSTTSTTSTSTTSTSTTSTTSTSTTSTSTTSTSTTSTTSTSTTSTSTTTTSTTSDPCYVMFTKANWADESLAANQDRITGNVWLTRGDSKPLFNAKNETEYDDVEEGPSDTEWAVGECSGVAADTLYFTSFANALDLAIGSNILDSNYNPMVVHLMTDDIYLEVEFLTWQQGGYGGAFSYMRSATACPCATE